MERKEASQRQIIRGYSIGLVLVCDLRQVAASMIAVFFHVLKGDAF